MLKLFNSFQIVAAFTAWPFLIAYLANPAHDFTGRAAAFYSACALYVVAFGAMVASVWHSVDSLD